MTADMRRQSAARGNEDLGLARAPVEVVQQITAAARLGMPQAALAFTRLHINH
jgi:hypothetical protein